MIKSMTGYGLTKLDSEYASLSIEIKTLNSKYLDTIIKLPREFSDKEIELKNVLSERLIRGKVSVVTSFQRKESVISKVLVNERLFEEYYDNLSALADKVSSSKDELFKIVFQMPDVQLQAEINEDLEKDWNIISDHLHKAIDKCDDFRIKEGKVLQEKLITYIKAIDGLLTQIEAQDPKRTEAIKERLSQKINDLKSVDQIDENRFEQELIYYIEKLDIHEEKVRLKSHLSYFLEVLENPVSQGKKLGFIAQELGREINTIGSKANDAVIQRFVVGMKEELEKIKEQLLNIV